MAKHCFGILPAVPRPGERYDTFEPVKYGCVAVDDVYIEPILEQFQAVCYSHCVDLPINGLNCCGITLLPPESIPPLLAALAAVGAPDEVPALLRRAQQLGSFVIHYGL